MIKNLSCFIVVRERALILIILRVLHLKLLERCLTRQLQQRQIDDCVLTQQDIGILLSLGTYKTPIHAHVLVTYGLTRDRLNHGNGEDDILVGATVEGLADTVGLPGENELYGAWGIIIRFFQVGNIRIFDNIARRFITIILINLLHIIRRLIHNIVVFLFTFFFLLLLVITKLIFKVKGFGMFSIYLLGFLQTVVAFRIRIHWKFFEGIRQ
mmetsp:Transcript_6155/g.13509  ORF Transcript_6155/g.13509 Transcript_6155/m.13509 type:complete len:212 (+) Transcript_6155:1357-1992(+)